MERSYDKHAGFVVYATSSVLTSSSTAHQHRFKHKQNAHRDTAAAGSAGDAKQYTCDYKYTRAIQLNMFSFYSQGAS